MGASKATLREKREQWLEALMVADPNSVGSEITGLMRDAVAFRIVEEARRLAPTDDRGEAKLNASMHELLDRCFFNDQMVAIRRLADGSYSLGDEKKGVYSLMAVLKDMKKYCALFKRKAMFEAQGMEYDIDLVRRKEQAYEQEQYLAGNTAFGTPADLDPVPIAERHRYIDYLVGVRAEDRSPDDEIPAAVFTALIHKLDGVTKKIRRYVDKFLAHSATPHSRKLASADKTTVTLCDITEARRTIYRMASFLLSAVLGCPPLRFKPLTRYDEFKYIDRPLVVASDVDQLKKTMDELYDEWGAWGDWTKDEFFKGLPGRSDD